MIGVMFLKAIGKIFRIMAMITVVAIIYILFFQDDPSLPEEVSYDIIANQLNVEEVYTKWL